MTAPRRRVAMLSSVHPPFDTRIFQKEARSLAAAGYDVTLVVPHERDEVVDGVRIVALPPAGSRLRRMLAAPSRVLRAALALRADVYHFHDPELIPVGLALKLLGKRVIYDIHEDVPKSILGKTYFRRGWCDRSPPRPGSSSRAPPARSISWCSRATISKTPSGVTRTRS